MFSVPNPLVNGQPRNAEPIAENFAALLEQLNAAFVPPTDVEFHAGDFTAPGTTWSVPAALLWYSLTNGLMVLAFSVYPSSLLAAAGALRIAIPAGKSAAAAANDAAAVVIDAGARVPGYITVGEGHSFIEIHRTDQANFSPSTNATGAFGKCQFRVAP